MKTARLRLLAGILLIPLIGSCSAPRKLASLAWSKLSPIPDERGVAGPFAGESSGALLVAGGANFPNGFPWQGGTKVWHDEIYELDATDGHWRLAGKLPHPLAYGVSVTIPQGVLCVGGSDSARHYPDVFLLRRSGNGIETKAYPPLPVPLANAAGALVGDRILVCGGSGEPGEKSALNRLFSLDLSVEPLEWKEMEPLPGRPRILPAAASVDGTFYIAGGAALEPSDGRVARVYLRDVWGYRPEQGWKRMADMPRPSVAAPAPAPSAGSEFFIVGGDDGSLVGFKPVEKHPGFPARAFAYDAGQDRWRTAGVPPAPRAAAPVVFWNGTFVIPSGEMRPGVRSPEVWTLRVMTQN